MSVRLGNLASALQRRYQQLGDLSDLDKAIERISQAVLLIPKGHADMPRQLNNAGLSLQRRFRRLGERADIDKAIEYLSESLSLTPQDDVIILRKTSNLGLAYWDRFSCSGQAEDLNHSLDCYEKAVKSPIENPFQKFGPALEWAGICQIHRPALLLTAYQHAVSVISQLIWVGNDTVARYGHIFSVGDVIPKAAAAAISMNNYELALEWLEEGKSIVWKQMLQLRMPLDDLAAVDPTLALQVQQVAHDLDLASSLKPIHEHDYDPLEEAAQQHRRLAEQWRTLIHQVRGVPGFETFLCPLRASDILRSAQTGPVVVVNVDKSRCDALIIRPGSTMILHVPLNLSYEKVSSTRVQFDQLVRNHDLSHRKPYITRPEGKDAFEKMLNMLWTEIVKPVLVALDFLVLPSTDDLPHITWCTAGPLSFLPLHAAGDYDSGEVVFKYVVSSYTPTLSALLSPPSHRAFSGLLAVGQSSTTGFPPLPGTIKELDQILETSKRHRVTRLDESLATPAAVLAGMEDHSWVHLACHASQDPKNSLQSTFYLHGGKLDLASIAQKQMKYADLAFLSACETATGDKNLSNEAIHLAAGMLMAGYRTVIATMWSIGDKDAPLVAEEVYAHLFKGGKPDARRAAVAVHKATARQRGEVGMKAFDKWASYIHIGL